MKARAILIKDKIIYYLSNKLIAFFLLTILLFCHRNSANENIDYILYIIAVTFVAIYYNNFGRILLGLGIRKVGPLKLTMRGSICNRFGQLNNITGLFKEDFTTLLGNGIIKQDVIINTHGLYAQGVVDILFNKFEINPNSKKHKLNALFQKYNTEHNDDSEASENEITIFCGGKFFTVKKIREKRSNGMEIAATVSLLEKSKEIEKLYKRKYTFYEIRIPKCFFEKQTK